MQDLQRFALAYKPRGGHAAHALVVFLRDEHVRRAEFQRIAAAPAADLPHEALGKGKIYLDLAGKRKTLAVQFARLRAHARAADKVIEFHAYVFALSFLAGALFIIFVSAFG